MTVVVWASEPDGPCCTWVVEDDCFRSTPDEDEETADVGSTFGTGVVGVAVRPPVDWGVAVVLVAAAVAFVLSVAFLSGTALVPCALLAGAGFVFADLAVLDLTAGACFVGAPFPVGATVAGVVGDP